MAHDGQDPTLDYGTEAAVILPDLLDLTRAAVGPAEQILDIARAKVRERVSTEGRVSGAMLEAEQTAAHGLAWLATYVESLRQMQAGPKRSTRRASSARSSS
jgi:(2S)-methylsuccinyl-CoA dehydrogenase